MNRCWILAFGLGSLALILPGPSSAGTVGVNGLHPFDNTIDDGFWNTTNHRDDQVSQVCGTVGDFDSSGICTVLSNWISFSSEAPGFLLFFR